MDFQDALATTDPMTTSCKVSDWLESLDENNRGQITNAVKSMPVYRVYRACLAMGLNTSSSTWEKHFKGLCKCSR